MAKDNFKLVELYGGKIKVKFFPDSHIYMVDGKRKGSVTGAINIVDKSPALMSWAVGLFADFLRPLCGSVLTEEHVDEGAELYLVKKEEAANIGTETHDWIDRYVKGEDPDLPEDPSVLKAVNGFLHWVKDHKIEFVDSEKIVYSMEHDFIGQMDGVVVMDGGEERFLVDYKVSNGLYPGVAYQTAAYLKADEEESGTQYKGRWAIRLSKETEEEYQTRQQKKLAKWLKKNPDKAPYTIPEYVPFEARYLDDQPENLTDDWEGFKLINNLGAVHKRVEKRFFTNGA